MNTTKTEYQKRLKEVEAYLDTIKLLDKGNCTIECTDINGNKHLQQIDGELAKILKANGFLILYNLIEATTRNSIAAILSSIAVDGLSYRKLSAKLRNIWISQEIKGITEHGTLKSKVAELSEAILNDNLLAFEKECINTSGNIDAQKIRDIAKTFGYAESRDGRCLNTIKEKRNKLAHGEYTFADVGKDYTSNELITFKDETVAFIEDVLNNVETYINNKGYLAQP
jgi:hypothetical protein